jgi:3-oxoacyl-[acyl-carrier protein] reductase
MMEGVRLTQASPGTTPAVIVTGGSRGLGLSIARKLAISGYCVVAIARRESEDLIRARPEPVTVHGGSLHFRPNDLGIISGLPQLVREIRTEFGPIYGLINNAALGTAGILATMRDAQIEQLIHLNTVSPLVLTKYVVRSMMAGGGGRIVNISSVVSSTGFSGLSVYAATKASMIGVTRSLAREVGPLGITVNAVAPGFMQTEMTRDLDGQQLERIARRSALRRLAKVDDVADTVEFLLSEKAKNITGTVLTVDAGSTA